jgi:hypothetical protein
MRKLRNFLALAVVTLVLFSCDTDYIQDQIDKFTKELPADTQNNTESTGGDGDDSTEKDD